VLSFNCTHLIIMKLLLVLLAVSRLALSLPHGPDANDDMKPARAKSSAKTTEKVPASSAAPTPVAPTLSVAPAPAAKASVVPAAPKKASTPAGCRALNADAEFPSEEVWKKELPLAVSRTKTLAKYVKAPDYKVVAMKYSDVADAVKFASKHNLRLSVIASGHDFLGRNDAPSGVVVDVSNFLGITVHESWTPSTKGSDKPGKTANTINPQPGKQSAATIGAGITTQVLNNALHKSKLVSVGAAHGSVTVSGGYVSP
jgi:FAD binding domain